MNTTCAACGKQLDFDAPRCVRCKSKYCDAACQHDHWRRGHKQMCKKIHRAGNAEQYHADKNYKEAVAEAVEACADDTKGQTCYICTQAVHWKTKEGLVRMCACRGTAGFAHVSCLAEQAKILIAEAETNNLHETAANEFSRWSKCGLCEQAYHGVVEHALGWACWKTYVDRPEKDVPRMTAMTVLGHGLDAARRHEDALSVYKAQFSTIRRLGGSEKSMLSVMMHLASCHDSLGRYEEALELRRALYAKSKELYGFSQFTLAAALCFSSSLDRAEKFSEALALLREVVPVATRVLGAESGVTLGLNSSLGRALYLPDDATLDEQREAWKILESTMRTANRVLGPQHPTTYDLKVDCKRMALKLKKALLADGRRQKIEVLKQALIKTKLHGELQARKAKDPAQDAPPPRAFARGWLDGPDSDDRWSSFQ